MRRGLVIGNWKMNINWHSAIALVDGIVADMPAVNADLVVCPPYLYIPEVSARITDTRLICGSQNIAAHAEGAYTGEISGSMLREFDCKYAIVGHSEHRKYYADDNVVVAKRYRQAIASGIVPILSTGDSLAQRKQGTTFEVVAKQIEDVIDIAGIDSFHHAVISYEPLWAIGTGRTATGEQAQEVLEFIRRLIDSKSPEIAEKIQILYGGSVKPENAKNLLAMPDIDGVLVGGASLDADSFLKIYSSFQN
ncbi:Triosephosphate isomerase [methanotrophic endosymbiont of Bathymodiolus azoricus (Menez Gwen)]|nr:Triosephosphate isomerase [methanotrophic endosymbiont of Bathymodiolus azoricus (Menez Gwen)]